MCLEIVWQCFCFSQILDHVQSSSVSQTGGSEQLNMNMAKCCTEPPETRGDPWPEFTADHWISCLWVTLGKLYIQRKSWSTALFQWLHKVLLTSTIFHFKHSFRWLGYLRQKCIISIFCFSDFSINVFLSEFQKRSQGFKDLNMNSNISHLMEFIETSGETSTMLRKCSKYRKL